MNKRLWIGLTLAALLTLGVVPATIQPQIVEQLYLVNSPIGSGLTHLYRVEINSGSSVANLYPLPAVMGLDPGEIPFTTVHSLAATVDGQKLYVIDKYINTTIGGTGKLAYYDLASPSWWEIDYVKYMGNIVPGIVCAAFSRDGVLYVASEMTDSLYIVDPATAIATLIGEIRNTATGALVDIVGADMVFTADNSLYFWTNMAADSPRGLYKLTLPDPIPGTIDGIFIGETMRVDPSEFFFFTGMAVRANGLGDLIGSNKNHDDMMLYSKTDASLIATLPMYLNGSPFDHEFGDMTVGQLGICTRTIGYWKNHPWNGQTVTICGEIVNEELGMQILWDARGKDFSMFFAQLVAAKLNTYDSSGVPVIDDAMAWLCMQPDIFNGDGELNWHKSFDSQEQKQEASAHWEALDYFNNQYHCFE